MKRVMIPMIYEQNDVGNLNSSHGPFSLMLDECEVFVPFPENYSVKATLDTFWWRSFKPWLYADVCFLHRPYGWYGVQLIEACKMHDVPLWVHHDDDILAIPESNPFHWLKTQDDAHPSVEMSYRQADVITCQSVLMQTMLKEKYGRDAILLPISLDDRLLYLKKPWTDNNKICWRGSASHVQDILSFKPEMQEVFDKYQDREFHFFTLDPRSLGFKVEKLVVYPNMPAFQYYKKITEINASRHIVLLEDTPFNRVKSHLAWLDGTLAGSTVFAPRYPEFDRNGCYSYEKEYFNEAFDNFMKITDPTFNDESWREIQKNYLVSYWNKKRSEILKTLSTKTVTLV